MKQFLIFYTLTFFDSLLGINYITSLPNSITSIGVTQGERYHISETLGQAICMQTRDTSTPVAEKPPLRLKHFPDLTKSEPCVRWEWKKCGSTPGCTNFQRVPCQGDTQGKPKIGVRKNVGKRTKKQPNKTQKMLGGLEVEHQDYPFVVQIRWEPIAPGRARAKCSGTVLNERWILTSAQCCIIAMRRRNGNPTHSQGIITFGVDTIQEIDCTNPKPDGWDIVKRINVESVEVPAEARIDMDKGHVGDPNYDICMLKTDTVLTQTPVELATDPAHCMQGQAEVLGWGKQDKWERDPYNPPKIIWPNNLRKLEMKALSDKRCSNALQFQSSFNATYRLCGKSITKGAETCNSDCGGPMLKPKGAAPERSSEETFKPFRLRRAAKGMVQCGVISRPACENGRLSGRPNVLTKVLPHLKWINQILDW